MSPELGSVEIGRYFIRTDPSLPSDPRHDCYHNSVGLGYLNSGLLKIERIRESWRAGESTPKDNGLELYRALTDGVESGLELLAHGDELVHPEILEKARKALEENRELAEKLFKEIMERNWGDLFRQAARLLDGEEEGVSSP